MIRFLLNGNPLPGTLLANILYTIEAESDAFDAISQRWIVTYGSTTLEGQGDIVFTPTQVVPHTLSVVLLAPDGTQEDGAQVVQITARNSGGSSLGVNWDRLNYVVGDSIGAKIAINDPEGIPAQSVTWSLKCNGVQLASAISNRVDFKTSSPGVYRIAATAVDGLGETKSAESAVVLDGDFEVGATVVPDQPDSSAIYLGAVYSPEMIGSSVPVAALPYLLASLTHTAYLLPGTTHFTVDLDPLQNAVDDEVVVRTRLGNWTLKGFPTGLTTENTGYAYAANQPFIPTPGDLKLQATLDAWNVHGAVSNGFNFRVRYRCYRISGADVYRYDRCVYGIHSGGAGERQRRFAALFTGIEVQLDADSGQNRAGTQEVVSYSAPEVTTIPLMRLETSGAPHPADPSTTLFFTDSNLYAYYEPDTEGLPELPARAVAGLEGLRPCYFSIQQPGDPVWMNRVKRLKGRLVIYVAKGAVYAGSLVMATVRTGRIISGQQQQSYVIPVTDTVYNPSVDQFQRVISTEIDLSDFQFSHNGVVIDIDVIETSEGITADTTLHTADETDITADNSTAGGGFSSGGSPCPSIPTWGTSSVFSLVNARGVNFDGACYSRVGKVDRFDGEDIAVASAVNGCHEIVCGPTAAYCYESVQFGTSQSVAVLQPLHFPAPFIAFGTDQFECYGNPSFLYEVAGTGTFNTNIISYTGTTLCGDAYQYTPCENGESIVVVYPYTTLAHSFVSYGSVCYTLNGPTGTAGLDDTVLASTQVLAVLDCQDIGCTGSNAAGSSFEYLEPESGQRVNVRFDRLDLGLPHYGAAPALRDSGENGLSAGSRSVVFMQAVQDVIESVGGTGRLEFLIPLIGFNKRIRRTRAGSVTLFEMTSGSDIVEVQVQPGDRIQIDIGNIAGTLSGRTSGLRTTISWVPIVVLPRLYHTVELSFSGSSAVQAVGFTGLTDRDPYTVYDALPTDASTALPNPDTVLSVQGASSDEYLLIRNRATGDPAPPLPGGRSWYAGQVLNSPLTFRFYAARENQGQHGEMDVWLQSAGTFPPFLKVDRYRILSRSGAFRIYEQTEDTPRNTLVVANGTVGIRLPRLYSSTDGEILSIESTAANVSFEGKSFQHYGTDAGLSFRIVPAP